MAGEIQPAPVPANAILIAGPTAVGKSEAAILLAEELKGEIISVDSMQVYRGLDIGTAKPGPSECAQIPHHLINVVDVSESFDAAAFVRLATTALADIAARGKTPILCGGTGLYFQALLGGIGQAPPPDPILRAELEAIPLEQLLEELAEGDPATLASIDRANRRRVVRAVEVIRLTGKRFSSMRSDWSQAGSGNRGFLLTRASSDLQRRIDVRVDAMFQKGLAAETGQMLARGLDKNRTASQALGYRQIIEHLSGQRSLDQTIELVKIRTRQFAKRQLTWFRKHGHWESLRIEPGDSIERVVDTLRQMVTAKTP
jgi:tRNA dimethylallyltransferase